MGRTPEWKKKANKTRLLVMRYLQGRDEHDKADAFDGLVGTCFRAKGNLYIAAARDEGPAGRASLLDGTRAAVQRIICAELSPFDGKCRRTVYVAANEGKFDYLPNRVKSRLVDQIRKRKSDERRQETEPLAYVLDNFSGDLDGEGNPIRHLELLQSWKSIHCQYIGGPRPPGPDAGVYRPSPIELSVSVTPGHRAKPHTFPKDFWKEMDRRYSQRPFTFPPWPEDPKPWHAPLYPRPPWVPQWPVNLPPWPEDPPPKHSKGIQGSEHQRERVREWYRLAWLSFRWAEMPKIEPQQDFSWVENPHVVYTTRTEVWSLPRKCKGKGHGRFMTKHKMQGENFNASKAWRDGIRPWPWPPRMYPGGMCCHGYWDREWCPHCDGRHCRAWHDSAVLQEKRARERDLFLILNPKLGGEVGAFKKSLTEQEQWEAGETDPNLIREQQGDSVVFQEEEGVARNLFSLVNQRVADENQQFPESLTDKE